MNTKSLNKTFSCEEEEMMDKLLNEEEKNIAKKRRYSFDEVYTMQKILEEYEESKEIEESGELPFYLQSIYDNFENKYGDVSKVLSYIDYFSNNPLEWFENLLFMEEYGMIKDEYYKSINHKVG